MARAAALRQPTVTGLDLKGQRVRRGLRASDVAAAMGVSRVRVTAIEALYRVRPELAARYMRALDSDQPQEASA